MKINLNGNVFEQLGRNPALTAEIMKITEAGAEAARRSAPVDSGDYRSGIQTRLRRGKGRNVGRIEFTDGKSLLVESKTGNAYRTLRSMRGGR